MCKNGFFNKIFHFLNMDLTGNTWESDSSHPFFGEMTYYGFKKNNNGYWECEVACDNRYVFVAINSPIETPPTLAHAEFAQSIITDLDATFDLARSKMVEMFEEFTEISFPKDWREAFLFTGMEIPLDADPINDWELSYECLLDKGGHIFTCCFENGKPVGISVDG